MRIIVNGQQAFGKACLEAMLDRGDDVVAVYCAPDKEGKPVDPIKEFALEKGLNLIQPPNYTDAEVLDEMRALNADLMVMAFMIIFVPEEARDIPTNGSICFHPSLLPKHRGPSSINWPIMAGATKTGLSIFWPDDGMDEGDILLQKEIDIGPDDTLGTVDFEKVFPLGVEVVLEAVDLVTAVEPPPDARGRRPRATTSPREAMVAEARIMRRREPHATRAGPDRSTSRPTMSAPPAAPAPPAPATTLVTT